MKNMLLLLFLFIIPIGFSDFNCEYMDSTIVINTNSCQKSDYTCYSELVNIDGLRDTFDAYQIPPTILPTCTQLNYVYENNIDWFQFLALTSTIDENNNTDVYIDCTNKIPETFDMRGEWSIIYKNFYCPEEKPAVYDSNIQIVLSTDDETIDLDTNTNSNTDTNNNNNPTYDYESLEEEIEELNEKLSDLENEVKDLPAVSWVYESNVDDESESLPTAELYENNENDNSLVIALLIGIFALLLFRK